MAAAVRKDWVYHLSRLDRRIIFLFIALSVAVPLILKVVIPHPPSPIVQNIFDKIESLEPGSKVVLSLDYGPSTAPENQPMAESITRHVLTKDCKLYILALWATGAGQAGILIEDVIEAEFAQKLRSQLRNWKPYV